MSRIDLAIRTSNDLDPNLIARRLTVCRSVVCATPAYLLEHPTPQKVEDLARHNCLTHSYFGKNLWHFEEGGEHVSVQVHRQYHRQRSQHAVTPDAGRGRGGDVAQLSGRGAHPSWRTGGACCPRPSHGRMNIYAVYASRKHMPSALRSLLDFLVQRFPETPEWDRGL